MPVVRRTPLANSDLLEIWLYIAQDSVDAADRLVESIDEKSSILATQSMMGRARPDLGENIRSFAVGDYLVFYLPLDDGIELLRVFHGARDIPAIFQRLS
ncbi:MAG TPA: type II toxin-antitoxin system RelE/ParE family toxin [Phycisphaerae bacterium]|nr:type II toxin-antitoxin system RelE/ParE family toxin [Phycisphaerae bacterium]